MANKEDFKLHRKVVEQIPEYIPGKSIADVKKEYKLSDVIKLASNENILGAPKNVRQAIIDSLDNLHIYPDPASTTLREKLAQKLDVEVGNLIVGSGSDEIITMISHAFLHRNEEVIMPWHSFIRYLHNALIMEAETKFVNLRKDFKYDVDAILSAINYKTKFIYITSPNNPTGRIMTHDEIMLIIKNLPDGVVLIVDEAYREFVEDDEFPDMINIVKTHPDKNIILLRTFSKIYGLAGLRVGYAISRKPIINMLFRVKAPFNVNIVSQAAAYAALDDPDHVEKTRALMRKEKKYIYKRLLDNNINFVPSETNFILLDTGMDGEEVFNRLQESGIIVRDMRMYKLDTYIRITIGNREQNKKLLDNLFKILNQKTKENY